MSNPLRPHFGTDGIRGNAEQDLSDDFVFALGKAISTAIFDDMTSKKVSHDLEIVIGRDTRSSGPRIEAALSKGLIAAGAKVTTIGILPTPAISLYVSKRNVFACAITASHNPAQDNGIKVFSRGGTKTNEDFENKIEKYIDVYLENPVDIEMETTFEIEDESNAAFDTYLDWLGSLFTGLDLHGIKVGLDCANGASYETATKAFESFGAEVFAINTENDGININNKCGATNLSSLIHLVENKDTDIAFAFDGDADRIMVLDNNAMAYDGDYILGLLASNTDLEPRTVVATSMSNGALKKYLKTINYEFIETNVGDKNVALGMSQSGSKLGGEQSGHIIVSDFAPFGDGVLVALLVSKIFASKRNSHEDLESGEMLSLFTPMVQLHEKVVVSNKSLAESSPKIDLAINAQLEILGEGARIVIRPSGTEDIVRIMVEANEEDLAIKSINDLINVVSQACKE